MRGIWHFPQSSTTLFTQYINNFLKLKQETHGWPVDIGDNEAKRQAYIDQYYAHEGIHLDYANIEKKSTKQALAKLMLNNFGGKFGQQVPSGIHYFTRQTVPVVE